MPKRSSQYTRQQLGAVTSIIEEKKQLPRSRIRSQWEDHRSKKEVKVETNKEDLVDQRKWQEERKSTRRRHVWIDEHGRFYHTFFVYRFRLGNNNSVDGQLDAVTSVSVAFKKKKNKTFHACPPLESHSPKTLSDNHAPIASKMKDQRRCWKVPYIVYYCNLFEKKLDLIGLRVDEFEDALLDDLLRRFNLNIILASGRKDDSLKSVYNSWYSLSILAKLDIIFSSTVA
ncbi:hypothetical protein BpHYR1_019359 [Brachionus plicatilis]|uniref:Uncharacterized protein n=1 Tax=Brachionus plicatilis TaxID=10195 RepID=A0A3M7Q6L6_BRAPC|nr:hypothetical protein BpHYR1_019359 [Brachionus plicatilis]